MRPLMIALAALLLHACTVGPPYVPPAVEIPAAFRYAEPEAGETGGTAWWNQFQDPTLEALIEEAARNNKNVRIAAASIERAAALLQQSRSAMYPQVGYDGSAARQRISEESSPFAAFLTNPQTSYQVLATAGWEIDLWGRIRRLSEAALANLLATREARAGVLLSLTASVAGSYFQLLGLDEQLTIALRTREVYAETVRLFELQFKHGRVSQLNVEQARTQYETAAGIIPQLESQIVQAESALSLLLGRNPGPVLRNRMLAEVSLPAVPAGLPSAVLAHRPDIRQAEQDLIAANAQIGAARALYFPTISLTGGMGYASDELSSLFNGPARVWSYGGSLTGPIFTGGAVGAQVKQAEAGHAAALLRYEAAIQSAFADVENSLIARRKLMEQVQAQQRLVAASREYARLARLQYEGGYVSYLTVLSAQQQLFPAELNEIQYRTQLYLAYANLYKAIGGGWGILFNAGGQ